MRGLSLVASSGGHSSSRCVGLSLSRPLLLRSTGSRRAGSVIVAHGPSCSAACGILPDQGLNPCTLHWQADSQPLRHQGSPDLSFWLKEWRRKKSDQSTSKMQSLASYLPFLPLPCFSKTSSVAEANLPQSYSCVLNKYSRQLPTWLLRSCPGYVSSDACTLNSAPKISSSKINFLGYWEQGDLSVSPGSFNSKKELECLLSYLLFIDGLSIFPYFFL